MGRRPRPGRRAARTASRSACRRPSHVVMVIPPDAKPEEVTKGGRPGGEPVRRRAALPRSASASACPRSSPSTTTTARRAHGPRGPRRRDARDAAPGGRRPRRRSTSAPSTSSPGSAPRAERAGAERAASPSRARFDRTSTAGSCTTSASGGSRPGRARGSPPPSASVVDRDFDRIARALDAEPKGFTHRDYQSRNLMVLPSGEQAVIDFQDALLGPRQYDLVALLRDSYVELDAGARRGDAPPLPRPPRRGGRAAPRRTARSARSSTSSPCSGSSRTRGASSSSTA